MNTEANVICAKNNKSRNIIYIISILK